MMNRPKRGLQRQAAAIPLFVLLLASVLLSFAVGAQDPILEISEFPDVLQLPPDGEATARILLANPTATEADDAEVFLLSVPDGVDVTSIPEILPKIDPFSDDVLDLLFVADGLAEGTYEATAELVYTYCDDDSCFEVVEPLTFAMEVRAGAVPIPVESFGTNRRSAGMLPLILAAALLAVALVVFAFVRKMVVVVAAVALIAVGALAYGVLTSQHEQAQGIGAVLCTSCVGIEESSHGDPELSPETRSELASFDVLEPVEILVFYAVWCHSCPFAEAMVQAFAAETERITYRFIDVEAEPELAARYNVIRSNRTVVPATVLPATGVVLFGVEHLEGRLLDALRSLP